LVNRFVQRDWLGKDATGMLLPGRRFHDLRLLGTVAAGFPYGPYGGGSHHFGDVKRSVFYSENF
jgi:hypothetical protein